jgi:hypothetical protein
MDFCPPVPRVRKVLSKPEVSLGPTGLLSGSFWLHENGTMHFRAAEFCPALYRLIDIVFVSVSSIPNAKRITFQIPADYSIITITADAPLLSLAQAMEDELFYACVFSTQFIIETSGKRFECLHNLSKFKSSASQVAGCEIQFKPDFQHFQTADTFAILDRRIYDLAVLHRDTLFVHNGREIITRRWYQYSRLFIERDLKVMRHQVQGLYSVYILACDKGQGHQLTFVNGLWTPEGNHIRHIRSQLTTFLVDFLHCDLNKAENSLFFFSRVSHPGAQVRGRLQVESHDGSAPVFGVAIAVDFPAEGGEGRHWEIDNHSAATPHTTDIAVYRPVGSFALTGHGIRG